MYETFPKTYSPAMGHLASLLRAAAALAAAGLAATAVSGCAASASGPLVTDLIQRGMSTCLPIPDPGAHVYGWATPIAFTTQMFVNEAPVRVTVQSVSLIDPHNMVLRGAIVYEMPHSQHPLIMNGTVANLAASVPAALWARHQSVPGAVIAPGHRVRSFRPSYSMSIWEIAPVVAKRNPGGAWALGEIVTYEARGHAYTVEAQIGWAIGSSRGPLSQSCKAPMNAITAAWRGP